MFGEISLLAWMGSAIVFAIGGGAGFFIARQIKDKRTMELEQQLLATQSKLTDYQDDVNRHFLKSSLLFNKLTDNYREVYEHLATGAQKLCNEKPVTTALDLPDTKILAASVSTGTESISEDKIMDDTTAPEISAAEPLTAQQHSSEQPTEHLTEQQTEDEEHLGVESIAAQEAVREVEASSIESTETDEKIASSEKTTLEKIRDAAINTDTPNITKEELKTLEASEKEKEEADDVHLGAESTPGVELDHHKTHPSLH